jgi:nitrous oxide reductase accessory protein NosL
MTRATAILSGLGLVLAGCGEGEVAGPPDLRLGFDECAECGMIISEDRFSAGAIVLREGRREHALFDDIGCLLDFQSHRAGDSPVVAAFVHDHDTRAWLDAPAAVFLYADRETLPTPMGSGIAAFASRESAERRRDEVRGGNILPFDAMPQARRAWMEARFGPRRPADTAPER